MPFFSKVFRPRDGSRASPAPIESSQADPRGASSRTPRGDAWLRVELEPDEGQHLIRAITHEVKSRALTLPFLLLPFRPASDISAAKTLVRNYFSAVVGRGSDERQEWLQRELRLTEPLALCSVLKWCWSRLPGGVVTWEAYELFRVGEHDANLARDSFATFLPLSVDSDARTKIIFDFFDLLAAIAAHGKTNGLGGRKLSRLAGWWAFAHPDSGQGFDEGYQSWARAADATSHLFFAYLRSLSPTWTPGSDAILSMPRSLQALLQATEYPPETPTLMQHESAKVIMIVDTVSPTPFALLRRAKHFDYRDDDHALQAFAALEDPVQALTEECRRVLRCISSTNQSVPADVAGTGTGLRDGEWSRFEDLGFSSLIDDRAGARPSFPSLHSAPQSRPQDQGRPTTPSWADFLSVGFADGSAASGGQGPRPLLLPPDKVLPPISAARTHSSPSGGPAGDDDSLEPGELASITVIALDASFWWVWMTSLAGEEPPARKAVFGRCAVLETGIAGGRWLVMEEKVKGAASVPVEGAHIVEKKSRFGLTKRGRGISWRGKSAASKSPPPPLPSPSPSPSHAPTPYGASRPTPMSKTSIGPDSHARIQAAARALQQKEQRAPGVGGSNGHPPAARRARTDDGRSTKTNSVFTLQPLIMREAAPAMKWANNFDQDHVRDADRTSHAAERAHQSSATLPPNAMRRATEEESSSSAPPPPAGPGREMSTDRELPALPPEASSHGAPPPPSPDQKILPRDMKGPPPESPAVPSPDVHGTAPWAMSRTTLPGSEFPSPIESDPVPPPYSREQSPPPHSPATASPPVPAMRNESVDSTQQPTAETTPDATPATEVEPASPPKSDRAPAHKKEARRLRKRSGGGGGGFKKFFGRKSPERQPPAEPRPSFSPHDHRGFEHARPGLGRRLSSTHRSRSPTPRETVTGDPEPTASTTELGAPPSTRGTPMASTVSIAEPPVPEPTERPEPPRVVLSRPDPDATAEAILGQSIHHAPPTPAVSDVPGMVPETQPARPVSPLEPAEAAMVTPADETVSEPSIETPPSGTPVTSAASAAAATSVAPPPDRWAQIRKNAAERAAARASVDPGRFASSARSDEGDTSGEETIESRVARIKARVAELTGNMDDGTGTAANPRPMIRSG